MGARRVLVVSDDNIIQTELLDDILEYLKETGLDYVVWSGVLPNPRDRDVLAGVAYLCYC
ncbi:MAG: iron-containing alcohol dehydrogenase [Desulfotomaculum sp.]|nr:iron-containing alcohol dehydrogenase [Desulfotomaculum sp.]